MTDRRETRMQRDPGEDCPPTKSTPAARLLENVIQEAEALPVTKTQASAGRGPAAEENAIQRLPAKFGRYRLIRELGRGGMGTVVLAEDTQLSRQVALKIPFLKKASDTRTLKRFEREARAAAALSHPNLCPVYDFGTFQKHHYLSMAYIEGKPLQAFLDNKSPIPQRTAAGIIKKIAQALQHAHERGIIHRDLKPSNIMIEPKLGPIVTDFGLARCLDEDGDSPLTQDGVAIGTPSYMSPEQLDGDSSQIGPQSDIFSLGLILFEMLTGERRFQGKVTRIIGQILTKDPASLCEFRADVDPDLDLICRKMMARSPAERYASMSEVAGVMRAYLKGELSTQKSPAAGHEMSSDPEAFLLGLSAGDETGQPAPSTHSGAALMPTQPEFIPPLVISEDDSRASRILHRSSAKRPRSLLATVTAGLAAAVLAYALYHAIDAGKALETGLSTPSSAADPVSNLADSTPSESSSPQRTVSLNSSSNEPNPANENDPPAEVQWKVERVGLDWNEPPVADPAAQVPIPAASVPPGVSKPAAPPEPEALKLKPAKGKLDFQAIVEKTINGSPTVKKFSTPRSMLSELAQLERRQKDEDKSLERLRMVVVLNGNAFEFQQAKNARELVAALEEAIPQTIPIEDIFARLESLNSELAEPLPISLSALDKQRIDKEIQKLFAARFQQLESHLIFSRVSQPQEEVDKAQALFEQECQKIKGLPKRYPLPKLRIRISTFGTGTSPTSRYYVGDADRVKEQSPRSQLLKRIATALNNGKLIPAET